MNRVIPASDTRGRALTRTIGLGAFLLASASAANAHADLMNWNKPAYQFDSGGRPTVALGSGPMTSGLKWEFEAHQGASGDMWYSWGWAVGLNAIAVGSSSREDNGYAPAVASAGPNPNLPMVVEVHQGVAGFGPLWAHLATTSGTSVALSPKFTFANSNQYDNGYVPAVAAASMSSSESVVVEVHQGQTGAGPLWYHVGTVSTGTGTPSLAWKADAYAYDNGEHPSVAMTVLPSGSNPSGMVVVEVHQGGAGFGPLWYRTGVVNTSTLNVTWNNSYQYDNGFAPAVTVEGDRVYEVHQGGTGYGPLWYHTGVISGSGIVWDANAHQYDTGFAPAVAWNEGANMGLEVHQGTAGVGPLWQHAFAPAVDVPYYSQEEDDWCWLTSALMVMDYVEGSYDSPAQGNPTYAEDSECDEANFEQSKRGGWGPGGAQVNCCLNMSWSSTSACNQGGQESHVWDDYGYHYTEVAGPSSFTTLQNEIASGSPIVFDVTWNDGSGSHVMVVAGTEVDSSNNEWVLVNDPKPAYGPSLYTYAYWSNENNKQYDFINTTNYYNFYL